MEVINNIDIVGVVIERIGSLVLLFAIGWLLYRFHCLKDGTLQDLSRFVADIAMPLLFFYSMLNTNIFEVAPHYFILLYAGMLVCLVGFLLAWLSLKWLKLEEPQKSTYLAMCIHGNVGFIPLPLVYALFGDEGVIACLMYIIGNNIILFTFTTSLLNRSVGKPLSFNTMLCSFIHPQILAVFAGMAGSLFISHSSSQAPVWILEPIGMLGKTTLPMAMLVVGATLAGLTLNRDIHVPMQTGVFTIRLLALPLISLLLLVRAPQPMLIATVLMIQVSMPTFGAATAYVKRFGGDANQAAAGVMFTTLGAAIMLPLWLMLSMHYHLITAF